MHGSLHQQQQEACKVHPSLCNDWIVDKAQTWRWWLDQVQKWTTARKNELTSSWRAIKYCYSWKETNYSHNGKYNIRSINIIISVLSQWITMWNVLLIICSPATVLLLYSTLHHTPIFLFPCMHFVFPFAWSWYLAYLTCFYVSIYSLHTLDYYSCCCCCTMGCTYYSGFSNTACRILDAINTPFETVNVLDDEAIRSGIKVYSSWPTIPQLCT